MAISTAGGARLGAARRGLAGHGRHGNGEAGLKHGNGGDGELAQELLAITKKVKITEPKFQEAIINIRGTSPYVQHAFSMKAQVKMEETQRAGSQARTRKAREARRFEEDYQAAMHRSTENWIGIPAPSFRNALISACKTVGFFQTRAKLALFVIADGTDAVDGTPLVKIQGEPEMHKSYARNESGVADLRWRPMWREWSAAVHLEWDSDMLSAADVVNLMMRAGRQIGIGEGRPDSKKSNGLGWGTFEVLP